MYTIAGNTSQQAVTSSKRKSKDLQPPYNVVITGATKGVALSSEGSFTAFVDKISSVAQYLPGKKSSFDVQVLARHWQQNFSKQGTQW